MILTGQGSSETRTVLPKVMVRCWFAVNTLPTIVPKLHSSTLGYDLSRLAMDLMSDRGCLAPGEPTAPAMGMS